MLAEKLAIGKKNASGIVEILTFIQNTDFSEITEEICSKLIEQVIVGVYEKKGTVNYGKQPLRFQIYEIGFIDELVDVSYKTFRERIEAVLLRRYADHIVTKRPWTDLQHYEKGTAKRKHQLQYDRHRTQKKADHRIYQTRNVC